MTKKTKLFSITRKDFDVQHFCSGGPGGQKQNKTASGCRIVHKASGAVGESRQERSQAQNKKLAFKRLTESKKFRTWIRVEVAARLKGYADAEEMVRRQTTPDKLQVEVKDEEGNWVPE